MVRCSVNFSYTDTCSHWPASSDQQGMLVCFNCGSALTGRDLSIPPTPVPTLIGTSTVPSPTEESAIKRWLLDIDSDLSQLDGEIDRVQAVLDTLRRKHQMLSDARKQHTDLLSAVRRLPVELLSEIFTLSLPDDWKYKIYDFRRAVNLPASISRYWRTVALSTPKLWNSISFRLGNKTTQADVDLARTWIARSRQLLLSIRLRSQYFDGLDGPFLDVVADDPVLDVVAEYAQRWEYADLEISFTMLNQIRSAKNCLPELHTLHIGHQLPGHEFSFLSADRHFSRLPLSWPLSRWATCFHATSLFLGSSWLPSICSWASPLTSATRCYVGPQIS